MGLRIYGTTEQPLFLARDVAEWIEHSNASMMLNKVDDDEKQLIQIGTLNNAYSAWFLTEDGLYEVLMQSRKPIAKQFKNEVKTILKQIRKTGGTVVLGREDEFIRNYFLSLPDDLQLALVIELKESNERLHQENARFNQFLNCKNGIKFDLAAKNFGIGRNKFLEILREERILQDGTYYSKKKRKHVTDNQKHNVPYQKYMKYFRVVYGQEKGHAYAITYIKPEGLEFLRKRLIKRGYIQEAA